MPTIPTGKMERELRKLYLRWLGGLSKAKNTDAYINQFQAQSQALIERLGGQTASLGALADFPVPKALDLSPHVGTIYSDMKQAAIASSITAGLNAKDAARAMFNAGMDKSYHRLERLARTETVSAYWKNAWGSISDLPALVMASSDLRDHPNGRCTPIPTLRSEVVYRGSISRDGQIYHDPDWNKPKLNQPMKAKEIEVDPTLATAAPNPIDVKTFGSRVTPKVRKEQIGYGDWRYIDDRGQRAAALLQNDYRAEQAIKKMAVKLRETGSTDGVGVVKAWSKPYTGAVTDVAGAKYTEANVREALEDAARWLLEQETKKPKVMYKGLDVPKDKIAKLFKEGADFDTNYSSFTTDEVIARGYSSRRASQQVIVRVHNTEAVPITGNPTADHWKKTKEHLVSGKGKVTKVTEAHGGRTIYVDVTF